MKNPKHAPVMCVRRETLPAHLKTNYTSLVDMSLMDLEYKHINFLNRNVVDNKKESSLEDYLIGTKYPQLLPYVVIKSGDKVLAYNRKGNETRLHGKTSIGIGGHIDIEDCLYTPMGTTETMLHVPGTIVRSCEREIVEEAGISLRDIPIIQINKALISHDDEVGKVHLGLIAIIEIDQDKVQPKEELLNARWLSIKELHDIVDTCENWSQILINNLEELQHGN